MRRALLPVGSLVILTVTLALYVYGPHRGPTIRAGMTEAEVEEVLGKPLERNYTANSAGGYGMYPTEPTWAGLEQDYYYVWYDWHKGFTNCQIERVRPGCLDNLLKPFGL